MDQHIELRQKLLTMVAHLLQKDDSEVLAETYERLREEGFSEEESRLFIAQCVGIEVLDGAAGPADFDLVRFERNLNKLPRPPYEEEGDSGFGTGEEEGYYVDGEFDDF